MRRASLVSWPNPQVGPTLPESCQGVWHAFVDVRDHASILSAKTDSIPGDFPGHRYRDDKWRLIARRERREVERRAAARQERTVRPEHEGRGDHARQRRASAWILHEPGDREA